MQIGGEGVKVAIKLKYCQLAYTFFINHYASLSGRSFSLQGLSKVREREQASLTSSYLSLQGIVKQACLCSCFVRGFGDEILPPKECRGVEISFPTRRA